MFSNSNIAHQVLALGRSFFYFSTDSVVPSTDINVADGISGLFPCFKAQANVPYAKHNTKYSDRDALKNFLLMKGVWDRGNLAKIEPYFTYALQSPRRVL
jgi:hypothetical protein